MNVQMINDLTTDFAMINPNRKTPGSKSLLKQGRDSLDRHENSLKSAIGKF